MRILLSLLVSLTSLGALAYEDTEANFAVEGPLSRAPIMSTGLTKSLIAYRKDSEAENAGVATFLYPNTLEQGPRFQQRFINKLRDSAVRRMKGTVVFERAVNLGEHAGREFTIRTTNLDGFVGLPVRHTQRVFLVGKRYYVVYATSRRPGPAQERFLDSFRLLIDPGTPRGVKFENKSAIHDDDMTYVARIPAPHLLEETRYASRAVEFAGVEGLSMATTYTSKLGPVIGVSTLRVEVDAKNAEALLNAARVASMNELKIEGASFEVAITDATHRVARIRGKTPAGLSAWVDLYLTPDGVFQVAVVGEEAVDAEYVLKGFRPLAPNVLE